MEKLNIAELLKNCPKGMELDCTICNNVVTLECVDTVGNYPIRVMSKDGFHHILTSEGCVYKREDAKCVIFPKGKTTWEEFEPPYKFKEGDVIYVEGLREWVAIVKSCNDNAIYEYVALENNATLHFSDNIPLIRFSDKTVKIRLATEEEKKKLFDSLKEQGYKWNANTNTLEKLPKFNAGDKVKRKDADYTYIVTIAKLDDDYYDYVNEDGQCGVIHISAQNDWELVPDKFAITTLKPFDKVLVRHNIDNKWCSSFFSHIDSDFHSNCYKYVTVAGKSYPMCIPYEGNEHLSGTTNNCIEYYKNW